MPCNVFFPEFTLIEITLDHEVTLITWSYSAREAMKMTDTATAIVTVRATLPETVIQQQR